MFVARSATESWTDSDQSPRWWISSRAFCMADDSSQPALWVCRCASRGRLSNLVPVVMMLRCGGPRPYCESRSGRD